MAQILRALEPKEAGSYMPMREMHAKGRNEVYKAVGEYLAALYELDEELVEEGCFLVELDDGRLASFPFGIGGQVSTLASQGSQFTDTRRSSTLMALTNHWRSYYETSAANRVGGEATWDRLFSEILIGIGAEQSEASTLCELAKMEARFF
jgi:hypothetical protein